MPARARPVPPDDMADKTSVSVAQSRPFARACLVEWTRISGTDQMWRLAAQQHIWVPNAVLAPARAAVEKAEASVGS